MLARETHVLAGQVLVAGFPGNEAPEPLLRSCTRGELGGITLFRRNLGTVHQVSALIDQFRQATPPDLPLLVAVDQEGGRVARLGPPVLQLPSMRVLASLNDPALTHRAAYGVAKQLAALGFTMNLAPVLDVDSNPMNPVIGDRAFGRTPAVVAAHANAFADGLRQGGVLSCGKHFPGHGDTALDSHFTLPSVDHDLARLHSVELAPFAAAVSHVDAIMTAHVVVTQLCRETPATLAHEVVSQLLRGALGFAGPILSDDLEMRAIADHYGIERAACLAIAAGCDALLICSNPVWLTRAREALSAEAERDTAFRQRLRDAARRFLAMRLRVTPTPILEPEGLELALASAEHSALAGELSARLTQHPHPQA